MLHSSDILMNSLCEILLHWDEDETSVLIWTRWSPTEGCTRLKCLFILAPNCHLLSETTDLSECTEMWYTYRHFLPSSISRLSFIEQKYYAHSPLLPY